MLSMLRIIEADKDDFDLLISTTGSQSGYRSIRDAQVAISLSNEIKAMKLLLQICDDNLKAYPTTYEQDCKLLQTGNVPLYSNYRHALIQIRGEKEVLYFLKDFANTSLSLLSITDLVSGAFNTSIDNIRITKHPVIYSHCRSTISRLLQDEYRRNEIRRNNVDLSKPTIV